MRQRTWLNFTVSAVELGRLIGHSAVCIAQWTELCGLPQTKNGRYHLLTCLRWVENHYKDSTAIQISLVSVSQQRLAELLGVTRQTLFVWAKAGLPRNENRSYDLQIVLRWLPKFYEQFYKRKYQKKCKTSVSSVDVGQ